jgi:hypothetical protein
MGDANLDGETNDLDVSILAANWQRVGNMTWRTADFNKDSCVNDLDASLLASHWPDSIFPMVPEPTQWVMLIMLAIGVSGASFARQASVY